MKPKIICVDFDGTCVEHAYPAIGKTAPGAVTVLRHLVGIGHQIILWTMRSGETLAAAEAWFAERGIPLLGVNANPTQHKWSQSPKAYGHVYIDDAALGCPLRVGTTEDRPVVDWVRVSTQLFEMGLAGPPWALFPEVIRRESNHEREMLGEPA